LFPQWAIFVPALSGSPASILAYLVGGATCLIFSRWREECADKLAFSVCSDEGKKGSYKLFEKIQKKQKAYRNESGLDYTSSLWRKIKVDHEGNSRLDLLHPPLSYRVRYLKEAYKENSWV
jgi:Zn-dependent protease with chaperone function